MDDLAGLRLAPGLRVVARGRSQLQVGLHPARRVLLPRSEAVESTLRTLLDPGPVSDELPTPEQRRVLEQLAEHGCLVTRADLARREAHRKAGRVAVLENGSATGLTAQVVQLLSRAGVTTVDPAAGHDVALALGSGEVRREALDPWVRLGTSHLVVRLVDGGAVVGPFVVPGVTACLRCLDAQEGIRDPDHVVVTHRYVRASSGPRSDGVPDLADTTLVALAAAWAARDVVAHLEGRTPSTWSRTLALDPDPTRTREQEWHRHPECGCCWSAHAPLSGTMGA